MESEKYAFYPGKVLVRTSLVSSYRKKSASSCLQVVMLGSREDAHEYDQFAKADTAWEYDLMDWEFTQDYWS
jgi:hypothetical protein